MAGCYFCKVTNPVSHIVGVFVETSFAHVGIVYFSFLLHILSIQISFRVGLEVREAGCDYEVPYSYLGPAGKGKKQRFLVFSV